MRNLLWVLILTAAVSGCASLQSGGLPGQTANPPAIRSAAPGRTPRGTVVFVHGFMRGRGCFSPAAPGFRLRGWHVVNWVYPSRDRTIEEHAAALRHEVARIAAARPGEPINFVTQSLGGLVVRRVLNLPDCPAEVRQGSAVLLAPPNRGSQAARTCLDNWLGRRVFGAKAGRQLIETPCDGFDATLGVFPAGYRVLVIAGDLGLNPWVSGADDGKVGCWETRLTTPHAYAKIHASHALIPWSPRALRLAWNFLAGGGPPIADVAPSQPLRLPPPAGVTPRPAVPLAARVPDGREPGRKRGRTGRSSPRPSSRWQTPRRAASPGRAGRACSSRRRAPAGDPSS